MRIVNFVFGCFRSIRSIRIPGTSNLVAIAALVATAACGDPKPSSNLPAADLTVAVRGDSVSAPDSVPPGWTRLRVEEDGRGHILVAFRLPATSTDADVANFLAALDTAAATPQPGVALGGPEIGDTADVIVNFTPGHYVFGCVRRGDNGHRHASTGEAKSFVVTNAAIDPARSAPPVATRDLRMTEFAYAGIDTWTRGPQIIRVENIGNQDHQLRLVRLNAGSTLDNWLDDSEKHGTAIAGIARMSPGEVAYLPVDLPAGNYIAYCLVTDAASKRVHADIGMLRPIQVQ